MTSKKIILVVFLSLLLVFPSVSSAYTREDIQPLIASLEKILIQVGELLSSSNPFLAATSVIVTPTPQPGPPAQIDIRPTTVTLSPGGVIKLSAVVRDDLDVIISNPVINWTSDNTAVATVSASGVVTVTSSVANGAAANITATVVKPAPNGVVSNTVTINTISTFCGNVDTNLVNPDSGYSYYLPLFASGGDNLSTSTSNVTIYENGLPLGPAHSLHATVRTVGKGAFSHWRNSLYFSASDNSDPRTNGRTYTYKVSSGACPTKICGTIDTTAVKLDSGYSYFLAKNFGFKGDTVYSPKQSSLVLFEDDNVSPPKTLGPAHSTQTAVRSNGKGAFDHLGNSLYFSASDNSDPRTNNRIYTYGGLCRSLVPVELTQVSTSSPLYGTFQSHNQKVVSNQYGIFMTYLDTEFVGAYGVNWGNLHLWKLLRSTDGGKTFSTLYTGKNYTKSPAIETDPSGNIYVFASDYSPGGTADLFFYQFLSSKNFQSPVITQIPGAAAGKFSAYYDSSRNQLYYFNFNGGGPDFYVFDMNGKLLRSTQLVQNGPNGILQYPLLSMNNGQLFAAWTTSAPPAYNPYLYWDIHFMVSNDGGTTWVKGDGTALKTPVVTDETGPTDRVSLFDEFDVHTWLSSFIYHNGALHFMYESQFNYPNWREHYVRYDLNKKVFDLNTYPVWKGEKLTIHNLDGFFATNPNDATALLYAISTDQFIASKNRLTVLASDDNGQTWFDYAVSKPFIQPYAIGGSRLAVSGGYIIGSLTNLVSNPNPPLNSSEIWFFRIKAQ